MAVKKIVDRPMIADYIKIEEAFVEMRVYTQIDETDTPVIKSKRYTVDSDATKILTGHDTVFAISGDMYSGDETTAFFRGIFEQKKIGSDCMTEYIRVNLDQPTTEGTYYARNFMSTMVEISGITGTEGDVIIAGNLHGSGMVEGEFDIATQKFTPAV